MFADVLKQGMAVLGGPDGGIAPASLPSPARAIEVASQPVNITGAALGLPGVPRVFDDANLAKILAGQNFIESIPANLRTEMVDKRITRLVKKEGSDPVFETIDDEAGVIKLAGRAAPLDVVAEFDVEAGRDAALDTVTRLAIGAGFDAMRDAGIPLVMRYKQTTLGTKLPDRWGLPRRCAMTQPLSSLRRSRVTTRSRRTSRSTCSIGVAVSSCWPWRASARR
jgi:hypothetical protein